MSRSHFDPQRRHRRLDDHDGDDNCDDDDHEGGDEDDDDDDGGEFKALLGYAGPEGSKVIKREVVVRNVGRE